jgi:hypothetical protein
VVKEWQYSKPEDCASVVAYILKDTKFNSLKFSKSLLFYPGSMARSRGEFFHLNLRGTFRGKLTIRVLTIGKSVPVIIYAVIAYFNGNFLVVNIRAGLDTKKTQTAQGENIDNYPFFHLTVIPLIYSYLKNEKFGLFRIPAVRFLSICLPWSKQLP